MRLFTTSIFLCVTTALLSNIAIYDGDQEEGDAASVHTKVADVAEDGTCDKDDCGDTTDERVKYNEEEEEEDGINKEADDDEPKDKEKNNDSNDLPKTTCICEDDKDGDSKRESETEDPANDLPVTSCICTGTEEKPEVGVEVLLKPESCGRRKPTNNDDVVTLHLRGYKASDNSEFITTYNEDGSEGLSVFFPMGVGSSIKGLELGVLDMCVGEKRKITIPSKLVRNGRREFEGDKIPRGETLIFEVELIGSYPHYQSGMPNMWDRMNTNQNDFVEYQEVHDYMVIEGAFPDGPDSVIPRVTTEWIEKVDKDKNGKLTWDEFPLPKYSPM